MVVSDTPIFNGLVISVPYDRIGKLYALSSRFPVPALTGSETDSGGLAALMRQIAGKDPTGFRADVAGKAMTDC